MIEDNVKLWCPSCRVYVREAYLSIDSSARAVWNERLGMWEIKDYVEGEETRTICPECSAELNSERNQVIGQVKGTDEMGKPVFELVITVGDLIEMIENSKYLAFGKLDSLEMFRKKIACVEDGLGYGFMEDYETIVKTALFNADLARKRMPDKNQD